MEYKIVRHWSIEELEEKVNELLRSNWQLQGGVSVSETVIPATESGSGNYISAEYASTFLQAMVRHH